MTKEERGRGFFQMGRNVSIYCDEKGNFLVGSLNQLFPVTDKDDFLSFMSDWFDECVMVTGYKYGRK